MRLPFNAAEKRRLRLRRSNLGGIVSIWSPASLFAAGEPGAVYDPSLLTDAMLAYGATHTAAEFLAAYPNTNLFTDDAGTIPVTAVGQTVGKFLDTSGNGNHRIQATLGNRPEFSARKNLLTYTEDFSNAAWVGNTGSASTYVPAAVFGVPRVRTEAMTTLAAIRTYSLKVKPNGYTKVFLNEPSATLYYATFLLSGAGSIIDSHASVTATITLGADGYYRISISAAFALIGMYSFGIADPGYVSGDPYVAWTPDGVSGIDVKCAQLEYGSTATTYQRVTTASDYDYVGFPKYLEYNGTNKSMKTAATMNLTATDKLTMFSGVQKVAEPASAGIMVEFSDAVSAKAGSFAAYTLSGKLAWRSRGSVDPTNVSGTATAPTTKVATYTGDISGALDTIRLNGVLAGSLASSHGTGNFGNYDAYFGARTSASLFFSGKEYGTIIRGAASTATEVASAENWLKTRTFELPYTW